MKCIAVFVKAMLLLVLVSGVEASPTWKKTASIPIVTEGTACNPATDRVGVTSGNLILSCQSGVWHIPFSLAASTYVLGNWPACGTANGFTATSIAACPAGYTVVGCGYQHATYCNYGPVFGVADAVASYGSCSVFPHDNYAWTYRAVATCVKQ